MSEALDRALASASSRPDWLWYNNILSPMGSMPCMEPSKILNKESSGENLRACCAEPRLIIIIGTQMKHVNTKPIEEHRRSNRPES